MTAKERWALAAQVGKAMGISKHIAFNGLPTLKEHDLIERILIGDKEAIEKAKRLSWYDYNKPTKIQQPDEKMQSRAADVKIMLWAIDKIGTLDGARRAFDAAMHALKEDDDGDD
jgi:hypothetical protein